MEKDKKDLETGFTHFDQHGNAVMVDVTGKQVTSRVAVAVGQISVKEEVMRAIKEGTAAKGDVLGVARIAGIMAAKRTSDLIPMCHPLMVETCTIEFRLLEEELAIEAVCTAKITGKTGVEMEALTGVSTALLTIYDMCKAMDKRMCIREIHLVSKDGGKSGPFRYEQA